MSLRVVHIFFIVCALVLSVAYGVWSLQIGAPAEGAMYNWLGVLSLVVSVALVVYLKWFVSKPKGSLR